MILPHSFGLHKTSLVDFPGKVASVIFFPRCNLRCPYCHNSSLVQGDETGFISRDELNKFLKVRAPLLGGVVISGGEPLLYTDLKDFILEIKKYSIKSIKLDTNGTYSDRLFQIIQSNACPDYIAMDIKTSLSHYSVLNSSTDISLEIRNSIKIIKESGIPYQFRTTVHPDFINLSMVSEIAEMIRGCNEYILNGFQPGNCLDDAYNQHNPTDHSVLEILQEAFLDHGIPCSVPSIE